MAALSAPSPAGGAFSLAATDHFLPCDHAIFVPSADTRNVRIPPYTGLPPSIFSRSFSVLRVLRSKRDTFWGGASSSSE
jgi:hypothetical protein